MLSVAYISITTSMFQIIDCTGNDSTETKYSQNKTQKIHKKTGHSYEKNLKNTKSNIKPKSKQTVITVRTAHVSK